MDNQALHSAKSEFIDFLEAAIHCILYVRELYPQSMFERRYKYGVPVFMSRHPDLNLYIREVLDSAREMLMEDTIARVMVCFYAPDGAALESFNLNIGTCRGLASVPPDLLAEKLQIIFRPMLNRILIADVKLSQLPEDSTFSIVLFTRDCGQGPHDTQNTRPPGISNAVTTGEWVVAGAESYPSTLQGPVKTTPVFASRPEDGFQLELLVNQKRDSN